MKVKNRFAKYVSQNILGMIGLSFYILADTFFIAKAMGTKGITALNLVLPLYNLIFAIGSMIGVGSAIRCSIAKGRGDKEEKYYFGNALFFVSVISLVFVAAGIFWPDRIIAGLGGNEEIIRTGMNYTRIFMSFAPLFMSNYVCNAFVRNDAAPGVAMAATLVSSLFNVVMDYVLMFPLGLGMEGAALATALSPAVGIAICLLHLLSKKSTVVFSLRGISVKRLIYSCQVGVAAFIAEISSGVITVAFNFIILKLAGNTGVAAYGVVANMALVAVAIFNGIANGSQPLVSESYGKGKKEDLKVLRKMGLLLSLVLSVLLYLGIYTGADFITRIFNQEGDAVLQTYGIHGLRLYFLGFVFAGINIVGSSFLSATEEAGWAFAVSVLRGLVAIIGFAFLLSFLFGMTGVFLAFPVSEGVTCIVTMLGIRKGIQHENKIIID